MMKKYTIPSLREDEDDSRTRSSSSSSSSSSLSTVSDSDEQNHDRTFPDNGGIGNGDDEERILMDQALLLPAVQIGTDDEEELGIARNGHLAPENLYLDTDNVSGGSRHRRIPNRLHQQPSIDGSTSNLSLAFSTICSSISSLFSSNPDDAPQTLAQSITSAKLSSSSSVQSSPSASDNSSTAPCSSVSEDPMEGCHHFASEAVNEEEDKRQNPRSSSGSSFGSDFDSFPRDAFLNVSVSVSALGLVHVWDVPIT